MKKVLIILLVVMIIPITSFAISIDDIKAEPYKYVLVFSDDTEEEYIDVNSVSVVRYSPPYYSINATAYAVYYNQDNITVYYNTYTYNLNQSIVNLKKKYINTPGEIMRQIKINTGITWRPQKLEIFHMNGSPRGNGGAITIDPLKINLQSMSGFGSPSYNAANFVFYKAYNMYFNPPLN